MLVRSRTAMLLVCAHKNPFRARLVVLGITFLQACFRDLTRYGKLTAQQIEYHKDRHDMQVDFAHQLPCHSLIVPNFGIL